MTGPTSHMEMTGVDGAVEFSDVGGGTIVLRSAKFDEIRSINALDAAFALQSAVGLRELSPLQKIACDATGDGSVSALDASRILQFALGSIATFSVAERCGSPWWIVPGQNHPEMAISPVLTPVTCSGGGFDLSALQHDVMDLSFDALLFGDCTGDWATASDTIPDGEQRDRRVRTGRVRRSGNTATVPVYVRSARSYQSLDLELRYDASEMSPTGITGRRVSSRALVGHRVVEPGVLRVAFASPDLVRRRQGVLLFVMFDVTQTTPSLTEVRPLKARVDATVLPCLSAVDRRGQRRAIPRGPRDG